MSENFKWCFEELENIQTQIRFITPSFYIEIENIEYNLQDELIESAIDLEFKILKKCNFKLLVGEH